MAANDADVPGTGRLARLGPNERHGLHMDEAIARWDEALPLGNGLTGCLIWGNGEPLRFSLDRGDLWDTRPAPETLDPGYTYQELIRLVRDKKQDEMFRRFDGFYGRATPTKIPAGKLLLRYGAPAARVESRLDPVRAVAEVSLAFHSGVSRVTAFLHASMSIGMIRMEGDAPLPELEVCPPDYSASPDTLGDKSTAGLSALGYKKAEVERDGDGFVWFRQRTAEELEYGVVAYARKLETGGRLIVYAIGASSDGERWMEQTRYRVRQAADAGWEAAFNGHGAWWSAFWSRSAVALPDPAMERMWYLANYLFGSSSRKGSPPMPLQGVWTADDGGLPPWKGDYHGDLNIQMSYWHYAKSNHLDEGLALVEFLWSLRPAARAFARDFFDAPGICLPSVMDIKGQSLGGWPMYATNLVNQIWLCQAFDDYWLFTGDEQFLRERAYPYFKETADCVMRWLSPGPDGKLLLPLSSSPEMFNNSIESWLPPNSNNDLALLAYLFRTLSAMAEELGEEEASVWRDALTRLPDYAVDEREGFMLAPGMRVPESHRHLSHLMCVYPLHLLDAAGNARERETFDATMRRLEELGTGYWGAHTFTWMAALYAMQGNGEAAAYQLRLFWEHMCSPNGFCLNTDFQRKGFTLLHERYFTLETNMSAADSLQEMLLQTHNGLIRLFPAIPRSWARQGAAFRGFRAERGALVSAEIAGGRIRFVRLEAEREGEFRVLNGFGAAKLRLRWSGGEHARTEVAECESGGELRVALRRGESCLIEPEEGC